MKEYPSIQGTIVRGQPIYAFDKLDGNNIRAEWSRKRGFYKYGTRTRLLGEDERILGKAPGIIRSKYEDELGKVFRKNRWNKVVCFFEFYGPSSFAGFHNENEDLTVTLIDVVVDKKGFVEPRDFLKSFGHLDIPALLYMGNANSEFIESVRSSTLEGMTFEGVICKGKVVGGQAGYIRGRCPIPLMFKIKSVAWLKRLRVKCDDDTNLFDRLA